MSNLFIKRFIKVPHIPVMGMFKEIGRNAFVDWLLILILNILILLTLISGGAYLYWQVSTGNYVISKVVNKTKENTFNEKELSSIINRFDVKDENSKQAKRGYIGAGDPSL